MRGVCVHVYCGRMRLIPYRSNELLELMEDRGIGRPKETGRQRGQGQARDSSMSFSPQKRESFFRVLDIGIFLFY